MKLADVTILFKIEDNTFFEIFPNLFNNLIKKNICPSIYVDIRKYITTKQQISTSLENGDCLVQF